MPVGTTQLQDFEYCDAILSFGQNVGSNAPRMLHDLRACRKRDVEIVTFNPLRERGLEHFTDPQSPLEMAMLKETNIPTQYHQVKASGYLAAMMGIAKFLVAWDDEAQTGHTAPTLDHAYLEAHTEGFDDFLIAVLAAGWHDIERESGLDCGGLEVSERIYDKTKAVIAIYGMGITQHVKGVEMSA